ncbi:MAG: amino acid adenylation domain-containing protein [Ignavibacteria bacterium]|nr:amino acid adenylation domain-containing protein [Ignavibacteria bacterium]
MIYTSGSTGKPKGVMIEHYSVVNLINAQSSYFNIKSDERILQFSNYCFDASVEQIFLALLNGASLVLFKEGLQLNSEGFENLLNEQRVSHLHATPSFLENLNPDHYKYLKRVISGGDVCKKELSEKWKDKVSFYNEYGPTETTVTSIEYHADSIIEKTISLPIGKPLANIKVYILNKNNEVCPVGADGEICIAGDCLARGYLNLPELTAEKFVKDPFSKIIGSRMYRTGDLGRRLTDGNTEYLGRTDEQVKIRGYRIEPGEIESVLMESELVNNALVISHPDGNGNKRLIAYVIPEGKFDSEVLQNFLKRKLPDYMIPALWVEMKSFPLTSNGKIDKTAIPDPVASDLVKTEYAAPNNELEIRLSEIWKEILKAERVGINDNFFELGGHSLNAIQLSSRLHTELNIKTNISTIFSNPTVSKLSKALMTERQNQFTDIKKLPEAEFYELSHSQKRFWILSNFKNGSEAYNVSNVFIIEGALNTSVFKTAFEKVTERHEILRTVFIEADGETKQKILPVNETGFKTEEFDLRNTDDTEIKIKKWIEEDSRRAFDLKTGPLLRVTLFREADDKYILVFNIHHIISDGWSKAIFVKEFLHYYKSLCGEAESDPAPLAIQYKDYAAWHNDSIDRQGQYWRELYEKDIPVLNFPLDFERPKVLSYFGEMIQHTIAEELTLSLNRLAAEYNMSLNNLLLTLYGLLVAMHSGQEEVVTGSVSSGRSHPDLEKLIGVFINFLPVKLSPEKYLKLSEYLTNSLDTLMKVYDNQDYPFDRIVEDCIKKRDISRNPLFDTMINFQLEEDLSGKINSENSKTGISIKPYHSMKEDLFQSVLDFKLDVIPEDGKLSLYLSYNSKLFTKKRMTDFLNDFTELLDKAVKTQDNYLSQYGVWAKEKITSDRAESDTESNTVSNIDSDSENSKMPVNICASFIIEPVKEYMEYWAKEFELNIKVNIAPYNQVFQQLLNPGSLLHGSKGMNILFIRIEDWLRDKQDVPDNEKIDFLNKTYTELKKIIDDTEKKIFIPFLSGVVPLYPDSAFSKEVTVHIKYLSKELEIFLNGQPSFQLLDLEKIAGLYDVEEVYDKTSDELGHIPFTQEYYAGLGTYLMRKVSAFMNPSYKVIALDCDNTLWKGICGELGAMNVIIDENYVKLQEFFLEKYNEGFLLALCSKNNEEDVWEVFDNNPGMKLKREHITAHRINWDPKPKNLLEISKELNLGMNSIIFIDDNEFETEQMSLNCPDVLSLTLPEEPESFSEFLNHIWAFDYFRITDEDRKRNEMYKTEKQRKEEENKFGTLDDFLKSLEIKVDIREVSQKEIERAVQLSMRTNQFNLNGVRKTTEEIAEAINDENHFSRIIEVKDRFGEYGIVGLVLAKEADNALILETFLLSCRVLGRNVEGIILSELQNHCMKRGLDTITALFKQTAKNKPFQEFLSEHDWIHDPENETYNFYLKKTEQIPA